MKEFFCLLACCLFTMAAMGQTKYMNRNYDYCIQVPQGWSGGESFTQNGAILTPRNSQTYVLPPRIAVGARANQPSEQAGDRPQTLDEMIQMEVDSLQKYGSAKDLHIIQQKQLTVMGLPARAVTIQYTNSQSRAQWLLEDMNVVDQKNVVYFVELKCHPKDAATLGPIYDMIVSSLRLHCKSEER